uniref:Hypothetical conserved protein n=1 Tax=uncultured Bacteroidota bacterium TaxID=152509 RepID=H5SK33_9BACT|nr:hypothetical conserved protein [uncultured Bacteroidetes bacterium]
MGGYGRSSLLQSPRQKARFGTGALQNLLLSFARGKGWGFAAGLEPQTLQGYTSSFHTDAPLPLHYTEKNEGLLTLACLQAALRWKDLAMGYQFGYLWGTYTRQRSLQSSAQAFPDYLTTQLRVAGIQHRIGILWQDSLPNGTLQMSLTYTLPTSLARELTYYLQKNFSLTNILLDTLGVGKDRWRLGSQLRGGALWAANRWQIGIEGGYQAPSQAWIGAGLVEAQPRPGWDLRIGGELIPDPRSPAFYKRIRYQLGGFAVQPPFAPIRQYGATAGIGWQLPRSPNLLFLAVERGWIPSPTLRETYTQITLGAVFRELWFVPPRID